MKIKEGKNRQYTFNLALVTIAGQVGCVTTIIVLVSLLLGLFIDNRLDTRPTFTIILVVVSVPFTLGAMFWIVRNVTSRLKTEPKKESDTLREEENLGTEE